MPLNKKGKKIMKAMKKQYGADEGEAVFYASKNKGVIDEVERKALGGNVKSKKEKLAAIAEPFDKVTKRDVITARREKLKFKDGKSVNVRVPMEPDDETLDRIEQERRESGFSKTQQDIEAIMAGEKSGPAVKDKKLKRRGDDEPVGKFEMGGAVKAAILIMDSGPQPEKAQVKGTKFSGTF